MKKGKVLTVIGVVVILVIWVAILPACKTEEPAAEETTAAAEETTAAAEETTAAAEPYDIVVVVKLEHPWLDEMEKGILEAGEELGVNAYMIGPADADASQQVAMVEDSIAKGVDAIVVVPNDPAALEPVFEKANSKGILTFTNESTEQQNVSFDFEMFDNATFGRHLGDLMVEYMGDTGEYVNFVASLTTPAHNQWVDARVEYFEEKYPNLIEVRDRVETKEDTKVAYEKTLELLKTYPNLKGFVGSSGATAPGIALAIEEKGLEDETAVTGFANPSMDQEYLKSGAMDAGAFWSPPDSGYAAVWIANYVLNGGTITEGMEIPRLGNITVDGKVIYGGVEGILTVTAENVEDLLWQ